MFKNYRQLKQFHKKLERTLAVDAVGFILYLLFAGLGIIWLKIVIAVAAFLISGLCLYWLYTTKELLWQRSLWMSIAAASIIVCILFSLILNFP